jgi:hypothetical protein
MLLTRHSLAPDSVITCDDPLPCILDRCNHSPTGIVHPLSHHYADAFVALTDKCGQLISLTWLLTISRCTSLLYLVFSATERRRGSFLLPLTLLSLSTFVDLLDDRLLSKFIL